MTDASDTRMQAPRAGCFLLAIVPVSVALVFAAWAVMLFLGISGRPADGATVEITFRTCPEAQDVVAARAGLIGLTDASFSPSPDGFRLTATLPSDPTVADGIPATLAEPGRIEVRAEDGALLFDSTGIADAGVRMDLMLVPTTFVVLTPAATRALRDHVGQRPNRPLAVMLDGVQLDVHGDREDLGQLELPPTADNDEARMQLAARRGVVLAEGPLPCDAEVVSVTTVDPG